MSFVHPSTGLFFETHELRRLTQFVGTNGLDAALARLTGQAGLLLGATGAGWRVAIDNLPARTLSIGEGYAVDGRGRVLHLPARTGLTLPVASRWYWLRVSYQTTSLEAGYCAVSADGTVTGTGTAFDEILRGHPNRASRIRFFDEAGLYAPQNGGQEHEVLDVVDGQTIRLSTIGLQNETGLRYAVVGSFLPGLIPEEGNKYPFRYDHARLEVVAEQAAGVAPALGAGQTAATAFYLARVQRDDDTIYIEDKRNRVWLSTAQLEARALPTAAHPFAGVERVTFDTATSPRDRNYVTLGWGLRCTGWAFDPLQLSVSITVAEGGKYLAPADAASGDFDGWLLYLADDPAPLVVLTSIKPQSSSGQTIVVTVPQADPARFTAAQGKPLWLVPAVETVLIRAAPVGQQNVANYEFEFPACLGRGRFALPVTAPVQAYSFQYAYRTGKSQMGWRAIPGSKYYAEGNFNNDGGFKSGITPARTTANNPRVSLQQAPDAFSRFRDETTTGDLFGVEYRTIETATQVLVTEVGTNRQYQVVQTALNGGAPGELTLTQDQFMSLKGTGPGSTQLRSGNQFTLHFRGTLVLGSNSFQLVKDYVDPSSVGTVLKTFTSADLLQMAQPEGLLISAVWDQANTKWLVYTFAGNRNGELGEIKLLGRVAAFNPLTLFDTGTGLGLDSGRYSGWALCDGRNGTEDLRGRVPIGYNPASAASPNDSLGVRGDDGLLIENYGTMGNIGGERQHQLTVGELATHSHVSTIAGSKYNQLLSIAALGSDSTASDLDPQTFGGTEPDLITSEPLISAGDNRTHENRPPYMVLLYAQKIA